MKNFFYAVQKVFHLLLKDYIALKKIFRALGKESKSNFNFILAEHDGRKKFLRFLWLKMWLKKINSREKSGNFHKLEVLYHKLIIFH